MWSFPVMSRWFGFVLVLVSVSTPALAAKPEFKIEEASIADLHRAIQKRQTSCTQIVQAYIDRAKAYNGVCSQLVTADGKPVAVKPGVVRAGAALVFPSTTVAVENILPDLGKYKGPAIDYGHMRTMASDASVQQQYGMLVGIPGVRQLSALNTLNIRGERSVTCSASCDLAPAAGPLPGHCPSQCQSFRQQPDALEYAAKLDQQYGRKPDLDAMPMYCVPLSFKDVFDTTDMRTSAGADADYGMDAAPQDATLVARLRAKGAIIYAKANLSEYNGGAGDPGGLTAKAKSWGAGARSTWGGLACNPYDPERETGGSSSGSAVSVGANLAMCSICEETGGSCRQPAWRSNIVGLVTTKGMLGYGGAIGADPYLDRAGIHCKTVSDTAKVLDALKDPNLGYFDPRDIYSALPKGLIPEQSYSSFATFKRKGKKASKPLTGIRIGIVREYMVKHAANDRAVSDKVNEEIKTVLRDQLGATLVESYDPAYTDDPDIENFSYSFQRALAEILPLHMPEYLLTKVDGKPLFIIEGEDLTDRNYLAKAALGLTQIPPALNIRTVTKSPPTASFSLHLAEYLTLRGDSKIHDWPSLNTHSSYYTVKRKTAMTNWENKTSMLSDGITQRVKMREVMRLVVNKVMQQNKIDVLVNPTTTIPPAKIGYASQPVAEYRPAGRFPTSADMGVPEITVPAGFNREIYEPKFELKPSKDDYASAANETEKTQTQYPMPFGLSFWSGIGEESTIIKIAAIYEAATQHRMAPELFGPVNK